MTAGSDDPIPLVDLRLQHEQVADAVRTGWAEVVARTSFIGGAEVRRFEEAFAAFCGVPHCVGVANGTDALEIALRALGVGSGDRVALPANTFIATAFAVLRTGAQPVLVDVDDDYLLIDPAALADRVGGCHVVIPVHLFGQLAPMAAVTAAAGDAVVVEDAAQAQGATQDGVGIGGHSVVAGTSFYPGKNLGAYGDAGAILTADGELAGRMRRMGDHGSTTKYEHPEVGFNSRLDTLQAVVLEAKLTHLAAWNEQRREAAARYDVMLADLDDVRRPATMPGNVHVWHLYPIRVPNRDAVWEVMVGAGVGVGIHYAKPLHLQDAMRHLGHTDGDFPVAENAARTLLSLPLYPGITPQQQERVADTLRKALR